MRKANLIIYFLLASVFIAEALAETPDDIFGNITYMHSYGSYEEKLQLKNGKCEIPGYISLCYCGKYAYGDFDNDGLQDAAALYSWSGGGSGTFYRLAFMINNGKNFVHKYTCALGDRVVVYSLKNVNNKVVVDMLTHDEGDCLAGPTKRVQNVYDYMKPVNFANPGRKREYCYSSFPGYKPRALNTD